MKLVNHNQVL